MIMKKTIVFGILCGIFLLGYSLHNNVFAAAGSTCGNGFCDYYEDWESCSKDCSVGEVGGGTIAISDLDVNNVGMLPTSNFYFLKQWGRAISRLFTFNDNAKVALELKITNQVAAELVEVEKTVPNDVVIIEKTLNIFTNAQEKLNDKLRKIILITGDTQITDLLQQVNDKTVLYVNLLKQFTKNFQSTWNTFISQDWDISEWIKISNMIDDAENNISKTLDSITPILDSQTSPQDISPQKDATVVPYSLPLQSGTIQDEKPSTITTSVSDDAITPLSDTPQKSLNKETK